MTANPSLDVFVGRKSWLLFHKLEANGEWMDREVQNWSEDAEYRHIKGLLSDLKVVNDLAERCVKDVEDYANASSDKDHRDNILLVATDHRGIFQDLHKAALC